MPWFHLVGECINIQQYLTECKFFFSKWHFISTFLCKMRLGDWGGVRPSYSHSESSSVSKKPEHTPQPPPCRGWARSCSLDGGEPCSRRVNYPTCWNTKPPWRELMGAMHRQRQQTPILQCSEAGRPFESQSVQSLYQRAHQCPEMNDRGFSGVTWPFVAESRTKTPGVTPSSGFRISCWS